MAQSLNTQADLATDAIVYMGFPKYGKVMMGDKAFEFYNDKNVNDQMTFPWASIKYIEGDVTGKNQIGRNFILVLQNNKKIRFSSQETGKILKLFRERLGNDKVLRSKTFSGTILGFFKHKK